MTDSKINVAILGVGNCASSFVQGLKYYKSEQDEKWLNFRCNWWLSCFQI